jgi:hypothetical protein
MKKILYSILLALVLAVSLVGPAAAQTATPGTPITGQVQSITVTTDAATGVTTVTVALTDAGGTTQTVNLSVETATALGLVTADPATGQPVANTTQVGSQVSIDPATVIPVTPAEEPQHPVGSALADFFADVAGVDYDTIMGYHEEGAGFGVIAQALWLNMELGGDATTLDAIMRAKLTGDYSAIVLPDGTTPQNWGQFRQALLKDKENGKHNLGSVMSGHGNDEENGNGNGNGNNNGHGNQTDDEAGTTTVTPGNGNNGGGNGNGNGNSENGKGKDKDENGKGKGHNKP